MSEQYEEGHLGGCVKGGDDSTFYPKLWDYFINQYKIKSVLDLGCGEGHSLEYFSEKIESKGVEGCQDAINNSQVKDLIDIHDFTKGKYDTKEYEMVWCCEFVEHVAKEFQSNFLETIQQTNAKYILLTHALPTFGGYHHVNCQDASYWIYHLNQFGYELEPSLTRIGRSIANMENGCNAVNHFGNQGLVFVKEKKIIPKQDAIITWASGKEFCNTPGITAYVNSLNLCGFQGDKLVFTHDMPIDTREFFEKNDFQVIDCDPNEVGKVVRDRFFVWYKFLKDKNYRYIGLLDSKDVIFQSDPILFLEATNKKLYFVSEGQKHKDCRWNTRDQKGLQSVSKNFQYPYDDWDVICGGTILGKQEDIKNLIIQIWSMTLTTITCTDQGVLNFLYRLLYQNEDYMLTQPDDLLCVTAGFPTTNQPKIKDGYVCNNKGLYSIYHQYDRIDEMRNFIWEKYATI